MENSIDVNFSEFIDSLQIFDGCLDKYDLKNDIVFPQDSEPKMDQNQHCAYVAFQNRDDFSKYGDDPDDYENEIDKEKYGVIDALKYSQLSYIAPKLDDFFVVENCSTTKSYINLPNNVDPSNFTFIGVIYNVQ